MKMIFKYPLELTDRQEIEVPIVCQILSVQVQGRVICLWALVETELRSNDPNIELTRKITVRIVGTGKPIPDANEIASHFIGTVQGGTPTKMPNGNDYVWHVFAW